MKKQDSFYFDNFVECTHYSLKASQLLMRIMENYAPSSINKDLDEMHGIEHEADTKKHEMLAVLMKAFMTPIEREDILLLSNCLDEVTDKIEDVMIRLYINNITSIRPLAVDLARVVVECCKEMVVLLEEFRSFKKSKTIHSSIVKINTLEEDADKLFIQAMKNLHSQEKDPIEVIKWREVLIYLEKCTDATEHVADVVERVIMTNT